jgi:hypothetical protein
MLSVHSCHKGTPLETESHFTTRDFVMKLKLIESFFSTAKKSRRLWVRYCS